MYLMNTTTNSFDKLFLRELHSAISGITGLANTLVRPRYQANPPNIPNEDWIAFGVSSIESDYSNSNSIIAGDGLSTTFKYNQRVEILVSFYGDNAEAISNKLCRGLLIEQNRAELRTKDIVYHGSDTLFSNYEKINTTWIKRVECSLSFGRKVTNEYDEKSLLTASVNYEQ